MTFTCGDDPLRTHARRIWTALAGVPVDFPADGAAPPGRNRPAEWRGPWVSGNSAPS